MSAVEVRLALLAVLLVVLAAVLAAAESSVSRVSRLRVGQLVEDGRRGSGALSLIAGDALVRGGRLDVGAERRGNTTEIAIRAEGPRLAVDPEIAANPPQMPTAVTDIVGSNYSSFAGQWNFTDSSNPGMWNVPKLNLQPRFGVAYRINIGETEDVEPS